MERTHDTSRRAALRTSNSAVTGKDTAARSDEARAMSTICPTRTPLSTTGAPFCSP